LVLQDSRNLTQVPNANCRAPRAGLHYARLISEKIWTSNLLVWIQGIAINAQKQTLDDFQIFIYFFASDTYLLHLVEPADWPILLKLGKLENILPWLKAIIFSLFV